MYYKGTQQQCNSYNEQVSLGENYQVPTTCWAGTIKCLDGDYAILKHPSYESDILQFVETIVIEQLEEN